MIIKTPKIILKDDIVSLSVQILWETVDTGLPDTLWFTFSKELKEYVTENSNAFLICILQQAMFQSENIHVQGKVSKKLLDSLDQYQIIYSMWHPEWFTRIDITCDEVITDSSPVKRTGVMSAFSGGVDSFHGLWAHLPENDSDTNSQITHTLFVHGFDIPLSNKCSYDVASKKYKKIMKPHGIELLSVQTNLREFCSMPNWDAMWIPAVVGTAHIFDRKIVKFYLAEINTYDYKPTKWKKFISNFSFHENITLKLLSTETLEVSGKEGAIPKTKKIEAIADWDEVYDALHVCWENSEGLQNCCRCQKCMFNMSVLDMEGTLQKYMTFPLDVDRQCVRSVLYPFSMLYVPKIVIRRAQQLKRNDVIFDYRYILWKSRFNIYSKYLISLLNLPKHIYVLSAVLKINMPGYEKFVLWLRQSY